MVTHGLRRRQPTAFDGVLQGYAPNLDPGAGDFALPDSSLACLKVIHPVISGLCRPAPRTAVFQGFSAVEE
ncbi:hypothetical protein L3i22_065970 [Actinoplanes sp. L3-i22]|nr:hypothetical protein L3i22_065970 [Actinoplanes sp. L3-i22]